MEFDELVSFSAPDVTTSYTTGITSSEKKTKCRIFNRNIPCILAFLQECSYRLFGGQRIRLVKVSMKTDMHIGTACAMC